MTWRVADRPHPIRNLARRGFGDRPSIDNKARGLGFTSGSNLPGMNVARASAMTMSSWMPGGALVFTLPASLIEYSKDSSSSIVSGQKRGSGVRPLLAGEPVPV